MWKDDTREACIDVLVSTNLGDLAPVHGYQKGLGETIAAILTNAVDVSPKGGVISVNTRLEDGRAFVEITDNGIGISHTHMHRIFEVLYSTKRPSSFGLGLSIADNLITQQGRKISVVTEAGKGTTFTISLPTTVE